MLEATNSAITASNITSNDICRSGESESSDSLVPTVTGSCSTSASSSPEYMTPDSPCSSRTGIEFVDTGSEGSRSSSCRGTPPPGAKALPSDNAFWSLHEEVKQLGKGSSGSVKLVRIRSSGSMVAIKCCQRTELSAQGMDEWNEANMMSLLERTNAGTAPGRIGGRARATRRPSAQELQRAMSCSMSCSPPRCNPMGTTRHATQDDSELASATVTAHGRASRLVRSIGKSSKGVSYKLRKALPEPPSAPPGASLQSDDADLHALRGFKPSPRMKHLWQRARAAVRGIPYAEADPNSIEKGNIIHGRWLCKTDAMDTLQPAFVSARKLSQTADSGNPEGNPDGIAFNERLKCFRNELNAAQTQRHAINERAQRIREELRAEDRPNRQAFYERLQCLRQELKADRHEPSQCFVEECKAGKVEAPRSDNPTEVAPDAHDPYSPAPSDVVRLLDVYHTPATLFLLMRAELGGDLATRLNSLPGGCCTEAEARAHASAVLRGLSCMHAEGVVHRDLKPENVLLSQRHDGCIGDLGLAQQLPDWSEDGGKHGLLTRVCGSLDYRAPEMVLCGHGSSEGYGTAADMW
eukprot:CAMPEP_0119301510 /NCGR_PEP_ID=MMETSP1333-20130426/3274_1 /TAXON_ID=418940 /ORGANISM="Scyphosphaera apsteinii, Strain RCC1455" /LENGTH=580 /DNA_ID=CAMNT_0007303607 /DNA_START=118 /DNA_END=1858 /DNA_ORIENTATION=+